MYPGLDLSAPKFTKLSSDYTAANKTDVDAWFVYQVIKIYLVKASSSRENCVFLYLERLRGWAKERGGGRRKAEEEREVALGRMEEEDVVVEVEGVEWDEKEMVQERVHEAETGVVVDFKVGERWVNQKEEEEKREKKKE